MASKDSMPEPVVKTARCEIRPYYAGDAEAAVGALNSYPVWRNLRDRLPRPYTLKDAHEWIEHCQTKEGSSNYAITANGVYIGAIGVVLGKGEYRHSGELGYFLGEKHWGKGYMSEVVKAFSPWAMEEFNLARLYATPYDYNDGSKRVLLKSGFAFEGKVMQTIIKEGKIHNEEIYVMFRDEAEFWKNDTGS